MWPVNPAGVSQWRSRSCHWHVDAQHLWEIGINLVLESGDQIKMEEPFFPSNGNEISVNLLLRRPGEFGKLLLRGESVKLTAI